MSLLAYLSMWCPSKDSMICVNFGHELTRNSDPIRPQLFSPLIDINNTILTLDGIAILRRRSRGGDRQETKASVSFWWLTIDIISLISFTTIAEQSPIINNQTGQRGRRRRSPEATGLHVKGELTRRGRRADDGEELKRKKICGRRRSWQVRRSWGRSRETKQRDEEEEVRKKNKIPQYRVAFEKTFPAVRFYNCVIVWWRMHRFSQAKPPVFKYLCPCGILGLDAAEPTTVTFRTDPSGHCMISFLSKCYEMKGAPALHIEEEDGRRVDRDHIVITIINIILLLLTRDKKYAAKPDYHVEADNVDARSTRT